MSDKTENGKVTLENLSHQDFLNFGLHQIVYIKPIDSENGEAYALHAADGQALSVMSSLDSAIHLAHHNNLHPVTIH